MKNGGTPLSEEEIMEADIAIESVDKLEIDIDAISRRKDGTDFSFNM